MEGAEPQIEWRAHPARERRRAAAAGALLIALVAIAVHWAAEIPGFSLLAASLLLMSLNRFFFPSRFEVDREGITAHYPLRTQRLCWHELRRFVTDDNGGFLSPHAEPSRLDSWRGMHVLFGEHRQAALSAIRQRMKEARS